MTQDAMNPSYYRFEGIQPIDLIEEYCKSLHGVYAFDTGNIIKYASRWPYKNGVQDLKKCAWYARHLRDKVERDYANGYKGILGMLRLSNSDILRIGKLVEQITSNLQGIEYVYTSKILMLAFTWRATGRDTKDLTELVRAIEHLIGCVEPDYIHDDEKGCK